jgi:transcriptional regulator
MYLTPQFEELRVGVLQQLMHAHPLATVVTLLSVGINADHIPLHLSREEGEFGTLRGHISRTNPVCGDLVQDVEALAIFHGPEIYIPPSWYPTKREHGKVAPTWNFSVAHAYGTLRIVDDAVWLRNHLEALTNQQEASQTEPWAVADAPQEFTVRMIERLVGIEIVISKLIGKSKASQNQPAQNQAGVITGLKCVGSSNALDMAALVEKLSR